MQKSEPGEHELGGVALGSGGEVDVADRVDVTKVVGGWEEGVVRVVGVVLGVNEVGRTVDTATLEELLMSVELLSLVDDVGVGIDGVFDDMLVMLENTLEREGTKEERGVGVSVLIVEKLRVDVGWIEDGMKLLWLVTVLVKVDVGWVDDELVLEIELKVLGMLDVLVKVDVGWVEEELELLWRGAVGVTGEGGWVHAELGF